MRTLCVKSSSKNPSCKPLSAIGIWKEKVSVLLTKGILIAPVIKLVFDSTWLSIILIVVYKSVLNLLKKVLSSFTMEFEYLKCKPWELTHNSLFPDKSSSKSKTVGSVIWLLTSKSLLYILTLKFSTNTPFQKISPDNLPGDLVSEKSIIASLKSKPILKLSIGVIMLVGELEELWISLAIR